MAFFTNIFLTVTKGVSLNPLRVDVFVMQLCLTLCHPMDNQASLSMEFSRQNTGVSCQPLLQGVFSTQGLNLCLFMAGRFFIF